MQDNLEETLFLSQLLSGIKPINLIKQLFINSITPTIVTDAGHLYGGYKIVYANTAFCAATGYSIGELVGESPKLFQGPNSNRATLKQLGKELKENGRFRGVSQNYRKDGSSYPVAWDISAIKNEHSDIIFFFSTQRDLTAFVDRAKSIKGINEKVREFIHDLSSGKISSEDIKSNTSDLCQELKSNAALCTNPFTKNPALNDLFIDDNEKSQPSIETQKPKISAAEYLQEERLTEEEIQSLLDGLHHVELEIADLVADARALFHLDAIEGKLREISDGLFFLIEFTDAALAISEVADLVHKATTQQLSDFLLDILRSFVRDIKTWVTDVFVAKQATDIHEGAVIIISSSKQITSLLNPGNSEDDSVTLF